MYASPWVKPLTVPVYHTGIAFSGEVIPRTRILGKSLKFRQQFPLFLVVKEAVFILSLFYDIKVSLHPIFKQTLTQ